MQRIDLTGVLVFALIGGGLMLGAGYATSRAVARTRAQAVEATWPLVEATVVSVSESRAQDGGRHFRVTTEWAGPDGQKHQSEGWTNSLTSTGTKHMLHLDPENPARAVPGEPSSDQWFVPGALWVMGIAFTGIAGRVTIDQMRAKAKPPRAPNR